jgi:hypothetical protein
MFVGMQKKGVAIAIELTRSTVSFDPPRFGIQTSFRAPFAAYPLPKFGS